tara:strand:+ start:900 stop:1994 length:1095 start_codon:yes stop_codon:yes gene_type:complete
VSAVRLIFDDGTVFHGVSFSKGPEGVAELVFNTAMQGYQEVLTDPSYAGQGVVMTYPIIGNYGINEVDGESRSIYLSALIVRDYTARYSHYQATQSLGDYLAAANVWGITEVDTRALTRYIRASGAKPAVITASTDSVEAVLRRLPLVSSVEGQNLASRVTCSEPYSWNVPDTVQYRVAIVDCGIKASTLNYLTQHGCQCDIYPVTVAVETVLSRKYNGVMISNGPGDPEPVTAVIQLIQGLQGKLPIYGICLGHQLIALAHGIKTYKLTFGHHGSNHPVWNVEKNKIEITAQNHGFSVDPAGIAAAGFSVTHTNLNDQTVAGIRNQDGSIRSVQFHPEAGPGPHDSVGFFDQFIQSMQVAVVN